MAELQALSGLPHLKEVILPCMEKLVKLLRIKHRSGMRGFTVKPIETRQDVLRGFSLDFMRYATHHEDKCSYRKEAKPWGPGEERERETCRMNEFLTQDTALKALASMASARIVSSSLRRRCGKRSCSPR